MKCVYKLLTLIITWSTATHNNLIDVMSSLYNLILKNLKITTEQQKIDLKPLIYDKQIKISKWVADVNTVGDENSKTIIHDIFLLICYSGCQDMQKTVRGKGSKFNIKKLPAVLQHVLYEFMNMNKNAESN